MSSLNQGAARSLFVTGLRNAHALENEALSIMRPQVDRLENYPEMRERLRMHIGETEAQISRLDEILAQLGESNSTLKDTALSIMGSMAAVGHTLAGDEVLKNSFANFAFENFEIASYRSLITMAELTGAGQATSPLTQSLREEESMATWIRDNLDTVTRRFVQLSEAGAQAKR
jgi:ferritin-like metal-binding protein YciE